MTNSQLEFIEHFELITRIRRSFDTYELSMYDIRKCMLRTNTCFKDIMPVLKKYEEDNKIEILITPSSDLDDLVSVVDMNLSNLI